GISYLPQEPSVFRQILFTGKLPKYRGFLGKIADSTAGPKIHGQVGDFVAVQQHAAGVGPGETDENVERCRLSCAVRAEQPDHFTLTDLQFDVVNDFAATVRLA